ncbi:MAG: hypothetical protein HOO67_00350 [Candidatus Peribacteraceae bacterium]|nr:hypothetical protein [Candidatus Peribacteraceae bacterium]
MTTPRTLFVAVIIGAGLMTACTSTGVPGSSGSSLSSQPGTPAFSSSSSLASLASSPPQSSPAATVTGSIKPLAVPFTSQAPFADWGDPYQEACEEAAMLMVMHYLNGTALTPAIADKEILDLVEWETANGYSHDVTAAQMVEIAEKKFGLNARMRTDVTVETIKEELAAGNPVVIPAAGRDLGNPYFSGEGPWYHALTIIGFEEGWTGDKFIVTIPAPSVAVSTNTTWTFSSAPSTTGRG